MPTDSIAYLDHSLSTWDARISWSNIPEALQGLYGLSAQIRTLEGAGGRGMGIRLHHWYQACSGVFKRCLGLGKYVYRLVPMHVSEALHNAGAAVMEA